MTPEWDGRAPLSPRRVLAGRQGGVRTGKSGRRRTGAGRVTHLGFQGPASLTGSAARRLPQRDARPELGSGGSQRSLTRRKRYLKTVIPTHLPDLLSVECEVF